MIAKAFVLMAQHERISAMEFFRTWEEWESGCMALEVGGIDQFSTLDDFITNKFVTNATK
jgi:hypothetical protein